MLCALLGCRQVFGLDDLPPAADDAVAMNDGSAADADADTRWLAGYTHRKRIEIAANLAAGALSDVPIAIARTDAEIAAATRPDGSDLVFTAGDGTSVLPAELVSYSAGAFEAWIAIPTLAPHATTVAYVYYGGPVATRTTPWAPSVAGVWHMDGGAGTIADSARKPHPAMQSVASAQPATVAGVLGVARSYDGNDAMQIPDPADGSLDFGTSSFSYSVWVNQMVPTTTNMPLGKGCESPTRPGYDVEFQNGEWRPYLTDGTHTPFAPFGTSTQLVGAGWTHLAVVIDRSTQTETSYVDGAAVGSVSTAMLGSVNNSTALSLGHPMYTFHGLLDETRVYSIALSADAIATEYENATAPGFITLGPEQRP